MKIELITLLPWRIVLTVGRSPLSRPLINTWHQLIIVTGPRLCSFVYYFNFFLHDFLQKNLNSPFKEKVFIRFFFAPFIRRSISTLGFYCLCTASTADPTRGAWEEATAGRRAGEARAGGGGEGEDEGLQTRDAKHMFTLLIYTILLGKKTCAFFTFMYKVYLYP